MVKFQRQTRQAFPIRNLVVLGLIVAVFFYFLWKNAQKQPLPSPTSPPETELGDSASLRPAEWYYAVREWPDFHTDMSAYTQALAQARKMFLSATLRGGNNGFVTPWRLEGPGNIGARINCIAVHPNKPLTMYIGYSQGGVWKTDDGGLNWYPVFDGQGLLSIGDIEIDPLNDIVYVGTGDPNISGYPFIGDGLWSSADGGQTWKYLGFESQRIISKIAIVPQNPAQIFVAAMGLPFERNEHRGLYKTVNGGNTWQEKLFISDQTGIIDLVVSPSNPNIVYAAAWDRIRSNRESLVSGPNARIWKSTDGGNTWVMLSGGLPLDNKSRIGLAIDPANHEHLFASYVGTNLKFFGLFETFDGGQHWQENPCKGLNFDFQGGFAWYFGKIRINPFNPSEIWLLGIQSWRSTDGGETWKLGATFQQDVHADHHDLVFPNPTTKLLATDGGLYRTTDDAASWQKIENVPTTQFYRVAYNPHQPTLYYGGAQDNGTSRGNANLLNLWQPVFGGDGFQAVFHPTDPNIFYYEYQNGSIVGTTDGGINYDDAIEGIPNTDRRHWDMQYFISQHNPNVMYTGTYRVFKSESHLPVWSPMSHDLTDGNIYGSRFHTISTLCESPLDPGLLYVGTTDANVWRGNSNVQIWENITGNLPDRYVSAVRASPSNPDRVFVTQTGYRDNDFAPRIHRSDNRGETWVPINGNLPNLAINDLVVLPDHQDSVLFVATDGGVYGTTDGGATWERLGTGIPFVPVYSLGLNPAEHRLVAGSHGRSILSFPLDSLALGQNSSVGSPNQGKADMSLSPNPASEQVTLVLSHLNSSQPVELTVYDLSGGLVFSKIIKAMSGRHEERIDLHGLPRGVYMVAAKMGGVLLAVEKLAVR